MPQNMFSHRGMLLEASMLKEAAQRCLQSRTVAAVINSPAMVPYSY